jgi:hypothetical protein
MKRLLKTIAMILIVVIFANSFTSCIIIGGGSYKEYGELIAPFAIATDIAFLASLVLVLVFYNKKPVKTVTVSEQIEQTSFMKTFNALPKTQIDALTQKVEAVPETDITSFFETFNAIPQTDIIYRLNKVSDTELYNTVGYLNSLSEIQFISFLKGNKGFGNE